MPPGKRLGLTATQNLVSGQLLLVCQPLVVTLGPQGRPPSNNDLVELLEDKQTEPWVAAWLQLLLRKEPVVSEGAAAGAGTVAAGLPLTAAGPGHKNSPAAAAAAGSDGPNDQQKQHDNNQTITAQQQQPQQQQQPVQEDQQQQQQQEDFLHHAQGLLAQGPADFLPANTSKGSAAADNGAANTFRYSSNGSRAPLAAAGNASAASSSLSPPITLPQLQQIVSENAYSEPAEDAGAAALRELTPESVTGLWPEFSLLNHSCSPNAVAVVVGQQLLLRATAPILGGEEVTVSYLGKERFAPVARRRAMLQGFYGFHCQCERCMCEQKTFPTRYYPQDAVLLGLEPETAAATALPPAVADIGGASPVAAAGDVWNEAEAKQQQQEGSSSGRFSWLWSGIDAVVTWFGGDPLFSPPKEKLQPSPQHMLLQEIYEDATGDLAIAVQDVMTTDLKATARRLAVLQQVHSRVLQLETAVAELQPWQLQPPAVAARWLLATALPLLQLEFDLLELLLAAGQLPSNDDWVAAAAVAAGGGRSNVRVQRQWRLGFSNKRWGAGVEGLEGLQLGSREEAVMCCLEVMGKMRDVVAAVAKGSELHINLCVRVMDLVSLGRVWVLWGKARVLNTGIGVIHGETLHAVISFSFTPWMPRWWLGAAQLNLSPRAAGVKGSLVHCL